MQKMQARGYAGEMTHWTGRAMAKAAGVGHRSWVAHDLKPDPTCTDPKFATQSLPRVLSGVEDVTGLCRRSAVEKHAVKLPRHAQTGCNTPLAAP
jgi:hypothetical protein